MICVLSTCQVHTAYQYNDKDNRQERAVLGIGMGEDPRDMSKADVITVHQH